MRVAILLISCLWTYFFCIQSTFGESTEDHTIRFNIHLGSDTSNTDGTLDQAIQSAQNCLNQAFQSAGAHSFHLSLKVDASSSLSSEEEAKLPAHFMAPLLDDQGSPLHGFVNGARTNQFEVFLSKRISRSNVKPLYNASVPLKERLLAVKVGQARETCDSIYENELDPVQQKLSGPCYDNKDLIALREVISAKYKLACNMAAKLEDETSDRELPNASALFIHPEATANELGKTLAHELMHAFGGLQDRYKGSAASREKWSNNLMGARDSAHQELTCSLTSDQIKAILAYRKTGKKEKWP